MSGARAHGTPIRPQCQKAVSETVPYNLLAAATVDGLPEYWTALTENVWLKPGWLNPLGPSWAGGLRQSRLAVIDLQGQSARPRASAGRAAIENDCVVEIQAGLDDVAW